jgi:hypothetical protein
VRRFFSILLRIGVTSLLLLFLFNKVRWIELVGTLKGTNVGFLLLYSSLYLLGNILALYRWQILLIAQGINLPLIRIILSYLLFLFFNPFLPTGVGGDVARSYDLFKETSRGRQVAASVLVDRLVGFVALMLIALIALSIGSKEVNNPSLYRGMWGLSLIFLFILLILFWRVPIEKTIGLFRMKNITGRVKGLYDAIYLFRAKPKALIKTLFLSLLIQVGSILIFYFIARSFGSDINVKYFFLFIPLVSAISMLPVSLSGLGVRDAACVFLFTKVGMTSSCAFSMSLIWFFLGVILGLLAGLAYILIKFKLRKA